MTIKIINLDVGIGHAMVVGETASETPECVDAREKVMAALGITYERLASSSGSGESNSSALNLMDLGSEIDRVALFAKLANVELSVDQKTACEAIMKALPTGATIWDFINACQVDTAKRLGISLEAMAAVSPLLAALEAYSQPGKYGHVLMDECHQITQDPASNAAMKGLREQFGPK